MILCDFHNCEHLSAHLPLIGELRGGASFFYFETGDQTSKAAKDFANQIIDVMAKHAGDLMAFDTDLVGTYGYCYDILRAWIIGDVVPNDRQKHLYQTAYDHVMTISG